MRILVGDGSYAWPEGPWLRANMVSTVDGSAQGPDGLTGSINTEIDRRVFQELRRTSDVIVAGGGTARAEGYGPADRPIVVVSASGALPQTMRGAAPGKIRLHHGGDADDLRGLVKELHEAGYEHILCEGGPSLLGDLIRAGVVDELCATISPLLVAGTGRRIVGGQKVEVPLQLASLVEEDGTLLARWLVTRP